MATVVTHALPTDGDDGEPSLKRHRHENASEANQVALYAPPLEDDDGQHTGNNNIRTSSLTEPTMKLSGHKGSVYCLAYDPLGELLCSGSFDSTCLLWKGGLLCAPYDYFDDVYATLSLQRTSSHFHLLSLLAPTFN